MLYDVAEEIRETGRRIVDELRLIDAEVAETENRIAALVERRHTLISGFRALTEEFLRLQDLPSLGVSSLLSTLDGHAEVSLAPPP